MISRKQSQERYTIFSTAINSQQHSPPKPFVCLILLVLIVPNCLTNIQASQQLNAVVQPHKKLDLISTTTSLDGKQLNGNQHYQLLGGDEQSQTLDANQYQYAIATGDESSDASLVADLLNSLEQANLHPQRSTQQLKQQQQQQNQHQHGTPGHYEFEVAPKMEPPSAPKPPFKQTIHTCPGSDLFGGFSPKHTLCGNLYLGKVPLNPMGQNVNEQAYPFELIKNKTLQFLARSLPILKTEYETIPKVARYLPANQLLNPTSHESPLGHEHFYNINQQHHRQALAADTTNSGQNQLALLLGDQQQVDGYNSLERAPPFLQQKRRRRKRSPPSQKQHETSVSGSVTELLLSNATLVSSAHSARVGAQQLVRSVDSAPLQQFTMITKDGHRAISSTSSANNRAANPQQQQQQQQQQFSQIVATSGGINVGGHSQRASGELNSMSSSSSSSAQQMHDNARQERGSTSARLSAQNNGLGTHQTQPHNDNDNSSHGAQFVQTNRQENVSLKSTGRNHAQNQAVEDRSLQVEESQQQQRNNNNNNNNNGDTTEQQNANRQQHLQARSSTGHQLGETSNGSLNSGAVSSAANGQTSGQQQQQKSWLSHGSSQVRDNSVNTNVPQQPNQQAQNHLRCDVNGFFLKTVCQAAAALIEGSSAPGWLQMAKQVNGLYNAANAASDTYSSVSPVSMNPLSTLWNAFSGLPANADHASSTAVERRSSAPAPSEPHKLSPSAHHQSKSTATISPSSIISMINLLTPIMSMLAPALQRSGTDLSTTSGSVQHYRPPPPTTTKETSKESSGHKNGESQQGLARNLKTISSMLVAGLSLAGLYDWLGGSFFNSHAAASSFARRKTSPFDGSADKFVDTPASLATLSARQLSPGALSATNQQQPSIVGKQPPTPCPSMEEYISPTFARNYQGAWKYVVQIPHEGYFTQTIQRSSCVRQKCEFTDGVCHEAPRWVSLLVAEIFYPNAIFGNTAGQVPQTQQQINSINENSQLHQRVALGQQHGQQQPPPHVSSAFADATALNQLLATAPSTNNIQQVALGLNDANMQHMGAKGVQQIQNQQSRAFNINNHHQQQQQQQDPLQMTDSLNTYNHNLNNALMNAATELGLDPLNVNQMQQLANAHNYQLMQRNGLAHAPVIMANKQTQQVPSQTAEARVSLAPNVQPQQLFYNQQPTTTNSKQSYQQHLVEQQQQTLNNDYIKELALETIRQNPHLSIEDLIKSLQMQPQQVRKKRDTSNNRQQQPGRQQQQQQQQPQQQQIVLSNGPHNVQYNPKMPTFNGNGISRSSLITTPAENVPSINEVGSSVSPALTQQFEFAGVSTPSMSAPVVVQQGTANKLSLDTTNSNSNNAAHQTTQLNDQVMQQQQHPVNSIATDANSSNNLNTQVPDANQVECDGHDKIGCYVVRVYYDWFLVNGSCKCWKTSTPNGSNDKQQTHSSSANSGSGSFIRRIFTG